MTSLEWDEDICQETTSTPDSPYAQLTDRAKQECQKRLRAFWAVRAPQEELDPRIIELTTSDNDVELDEIPFLHYGLVVPLDALEPCVVRHSLKVALRGTPRYSEAQDPDYVLQAVATFLQNKGGLPITTPFPLEERTDRIMFALDDTETFRHKRFKLWNRFIGRALQAIRDEFGLGDQKAMWWWDVDCGLNYTCAIPDYNPPQINPEPEDSLIWGHDTSDSSDSDLDDSDSGSESE